MSFGLHGYCFLNKPLKMSVLCLGEIIQDFRLESRDINHNNNHTLHANAYIFPFMHGKK